MFSEKRKFKNKKGLTLSAIYEGQDKNAPVVVLCHGYGSSKDKESTKGLAEKLRSKGLCVYRFDFTGCGESEGKLGQLTPDQGQDDLNSAVKDLSKKDFALYGSSFGGYTSLIFAFEHPVLALGLKAPVSDYPAVMRAKGNEKENRALDFTEEAYKYDVYKLARNIISPTLIVHGDADTDVPLAQSKRLLKSLSSKEKELNILPGAGHVMRGNYLEEANNLLANFFAETLLN